MDDAAATRGRLPPARCATWSGINRLTPRLSPDAALAGPAGGGDRGAAAHHARCRRRRRRHAAPDRRLGRAARHRAGTHRARPLALGGGACRGRPARRARWITGDSSTCRTGGASTSCSARLFAHHLRDPALVRFLRWLDGRARARLDDQRPAPPLAPLGRASGRGCGCCGWTRWWCTTAPSPSRAASRRADWDGLLAAAGVTAAVRWAFPFRWTVSARRGR